MAQQFVESSTTLFPQPDPLEYSNQVAIRDVDNDGDLDVAFANGCCFTGAGQAQTLRLLINNGAGLFTDESALRVNLAAIARDVEFGDMDADGDLDMIVATDNSTQPQLLRNNGNGFFTNVTATNLPAFNMGGSHVTWGDMDNDGDLDLAFTNGGTNRFGSNRIRVYRNDGTGVFTDVTLAQTPAVNISQPLDISFGDLDGDWDLDLAVAGRASNSSRLFMNDGAGIFTAGAALPANNTTYSFDLGDFDVDGDLDILGSNTQAANEGESVWVNDGSGVYTDASATWLPGANNPSLDDNDSRFFDYDNDGDLDLIVCRIGGNDRIYRRDAANFVLLSPTPMTAITDSSLDVEVGDLNNDGRIDIVTAQGESGAFRNRMYINNGPGDTLAPRIVDVDAPQSTFNTSNPYIVRAIIRDDMTCDYNFHDRGIEVDYSVDGGPTSTVPMRWMGMDMYRAAIPQAPCGATITYTIAATDWAGNTGTSLPATIVVGPGDADGDGDVDLGDLGIILADFGCVGPACNGDLDSDGDTDLGDLGIVLANFGMSCF